MQQTLDKHFDTDPNVWVGKRQHCQTPVLIFITAYISTETAAKHRDSLQER